jgi:beta-glucanase (GH16 family)
MAITTGVVVSLADILAIKATADAAAAKTATVQTQIAAMQAQVIALASGGSVAPITSPDGTWITTSDRVIYDNHSPPWPWTLTAVAGKGLVVQANGTLDANSSNVVKLGWAGNKIHQENNFVPPGWWYSDPVSPPVWIGENDPTLVAGPLTITGISLSNASFTGGAPSGTVVGTISVLTTGGAYSGSLALTGTDAGRFAVSSGSLVTSGVVAAGNYNFNIVATQAGAIGSPYTSAKTVTASSGGTSGFLNGYHLTFDWEANDFVNNPTPTAGKFTTTLSSGLRYLGNGDQEYWADSSTGQNPFSLSNGVLNIAATYVGSGNTPGGGSLSYVSGLFTTQGFFSQKYGYFEMRAKLPAGVGMWPAFWMLDTDSNVGGMWPPELDVLEAFGAPNSGGEGGTNKAHWGVHSQNAGQEAGGWVTLGSDGTTQFHTYGVLWTSATLTFYYDGVSVASTATPTDYTKQMYMIVNLAVGGTWPGNATGENATMQVDYVRAFSNDAAIPPVVLQTVSSPDGGGTSLYGATSASSGGTSPGGFTIGSAVANPSSGTLLNVNLTSQTGQVVGQSLFGISSSSNNHTFADTFADAGWVSTMAPLDFRGWRLQGENLIGSIFPSASSSTGADFTGAISILAAHIRTALPNAELMWTCVDPGMLPAYQTSSASVFASQMVQIATYLESHGVHVKYWDCLNEPESSTSSAQGKAFSAAAFTALNAMNKGYQFGTSPTGPMGIIVSPWPADCIAGYPAMDYISGHWYGGATDTGSIAHDLSIGGDWDGGNAVGPLASGPSVGSGCAIANETVNGKKYPFALTEYGFSYGGGGYTNAASTNMIASCAYGSLLIAGVLSNRIWASHVWDAGQHVYGFSNYLGGVAPHVIMLSQGGQKMPGNIVWSRLVKDAYSASGVGGGGAGPYLSVLATTNGLMIINSSQTTASTGSIVLGGLQNTTLKKWQQVATDSSGGFSNNVGTTTTETVAAGGVLAAQTFPRLSVTVYSP